MFLFFKKKLEYTIALHVFQAFCLHVSLAMNLSHNLAIHLHNSCVFFNFQLERSFVPHFVEFFWSFHLYLPGVAHGEGTTFRSFCISVSHPPTPNKLNLFRHFGGRNSLTCTRKPLSFLSVWWFPTIFQSFVSTFQPLKMLGFLGTICTIWSDNSPTLVAFFGASHKSWKNRIFPTIFAAPHMNPQRPFKSPPCPVTASHLWGEVNKTKKDIVNGIFRGPYTCALKHLYQVGWNIIL